ncbi:MAG: hypothetical protein KDC35_17000 [Acidobacteria bacterium]|nr:hypothetical protein [Acidobacteriota bacterium]
MKKLILIAIASSSLVWGSGFEVVTHADRVDLTDHLEPGRLVLFDFYADWCGPCRQLEPHLKSIGSEYASQLVIKKVDIVNWNTPVTQQYGINSIPHLKLFDEDGNLISQGGARKVLGDLEKALGGKSFSALSANAASGGGGFRILPAIAVVCLVLFVLGIVGFAVAGRRERRTAVDLEAHHTARKDAYASDPRLEQVWYVTSPQGETGPLSLEDIRAMMLGGRIMRGWQVRRQQDQVWMTVAELMQSY